MNTGPPCPSCEKPTRRTNRIIPKQLIFICRDCERYGAEGVPWLTDDKNPVKPVLTHLRELIEQRDIERERQRRIWGDDRAWNPMQLY